MPLSLKVILRDLKIIVMKKTNDQAKCLIRDCFFVRQGNVGKDVFTRRYCMWKLRGVIVIFIVGINPGC